MQNIRMQATGISVYSKRQTNTYMQERGMGDHSSMHTHTLARSACLFSKGNQATGSRPGTLVVALSGNCLVRLLADPPGFCLL